MQDQHLRAAQKGGVELEAWVFGGRADQRDRAILHEGKEAVLLGAIEAMDLVDKQQGLPSGHAPRTGRFEHSFQIRNAGENRRDLFKGKACFARE